MNDKTFKKGLRYFLYLLLVLIIIYTGYLLINILIILAAATLLFFIFDPLVKLFEKQGFGRLSSTFLVYGFFIFLIYLGLSYIIPNFTLQMNHLIEQINVYSVQDEILKFEKTIHRYLPFFSPGELATRLETSIKAQILNSFNIAQYLLSGLFSLAAVIILVPFITFFFLKDSSTIMKGLLKTIPNKYFELSYYISKKISIQLGNYVRAWIFDATFVGISFGVGLYIIGIGNSFPLGVIAGLGHLIPYFGPVVGGIPAIIISIIQYGDFSHVPYIILLMATIYTLDNGVVQPYIFSKNLDMHPLVIILLLLAGGTLFGITGMLLTIPAATVIRTLIKEIYFAFKNYKIAKL